MNDQATLDLDNFPTVTDDSSCWLHEDGRTFFLWPARDRKTQQAVQVQVEVTSIRSDAVPEQLRPSRKAIEFAARELYHSGAVAVRLMRPDAYWVQRGYGGH